MTEEVKRALERVLAAASRAKVRAGPPPVDEEEEEEEEGPAVGLGPGRAATPDTGAPRTQGGGAETS